MTNCSWYLDQQPKVHLKQQFQDSTIRNSDPRMELTHNPIINRVVPSVCFDPLRRKLQMISTIPCHCSVQSFEVTISWKPQVIHPITKFIASVVYNHWIMCIYNIFEIAGCFVAYSDTSSSTILNVEQKSELCIVVWWYPYGYSGFNSFSTTAYISLFLPHHSNPKDIVHNSWVGETWFCCHDCCIPHCFVIAPYFPPPLYLPSPSSSPVEAILLSATLSPETVPVPPLGWLHHPWGHLQQIILCCCYQPPHCCYSSLVLCHHNTPHYEDWTEDLTRTGLEHLLQWEYLLLNNRPFYMILRL